MFVLFSSVQVLLFLRFLFVWGCFLYMISMKDVSFWKYRLDTGSQRKTLGIISGAQSIQVMEKKRVALDCNQHHQN